MRLCLQCQRGRGAQRLAAASGTRSCLAGPARGEGARGRGAAARPPAARAARPTSRLGRPRRRPLPLREGRLAASDGEARGLRAGRAPAVLDGLDRPPDVPDPGLLLPGGVERRALLRAGRLLHLPPGAHLAGLRREEVDLDAPLELLHRLPPLPVGLDLLLQGLAELPLRPAAAALACRHGARRRRPRGGRPAGAAHHGGKLLSVLLLRLRCQHVAAVHRRDVDAGHQRRLLHRHVPRLREARSLLRVLPAAALLDLLLQELRVLAPLGLPHRPDLGVHGPPPEHLALQLGLVPQGLGGAGLQSRDLAVQRVVVGAAQELGPAAAGPTLRVLRGAAGEDVGGPGSGAAVAPSAEGGSAAATLQGTSA
mmetsp:Transcript_12879/g.40156  ORF Transcript_12879/g.40156 Transcript_12879/m.40156 type:complete len:368 (+) Transcript_12879:377-1480(+)